MLTEDDIKQLKIEAEAKHKEALRKAAIDEHIRVLEQRKAHFFPKRIRFQWPIRFEEWVTPNAGCKKYR